MGVKERQERAREAVARAILDAARQLFVVEGYRNVSIRKIAEKIEYSPAAIYGYFPSKDDIFLALAEEGFHLLFADAGEPPLADPIQDIRSGFMRLYEFSRAHPEYFSLMFLDRTVPRLSQDWQRFGFVRQMKKRIESRIQAAIDALPQGKEPDAALQNRAKAWQSKRDAAAQEITRGEEQLRRNQAYINQQVRDKLGPIYQQVMQRRGANIMVETGSTLATSTSVDVSNDVLAALNAAMPTIATQAPAQTTTQRQQPQGR